MHSSCCWPTGVFCHSLLHGTLLHGTPLHGTPLHGTLQNSPSWHPLPLRMASPHPTKDGIPCKGWHPLLKMVPPAKDSTPYGWNPLAKDGTHPHVKDATPLCTEWLTDRWKNITFPQPLKNLFTFSEPFWVILHTPFIN